MLPGVPPLERTEGAGVRGRSAHSADGEPVDPVRIAGEPLQVVEMEPDAIVVACDLGGICTLLSDGGNDGGIAAPSRAHPRRSGQNYPVANAKMRIIRKPLIDGNRKMRTRRLSAPNRGNTQRDQRCDQPPTTGHAES